MELHRLSKTTFIHDLTGTGARTFGGRWNKKGVPMLYTTSSRALAVLENLVHISDVPSEGEYSILTLKATTPSILPFTKLGITRRKLRHLYERDSKFETQVIGSEWIKQGKSLLLRVPSTVIFDEDNLLVNPLHPDFYKIISKSVHVFHFNDRLFFPKT